MSCLPLSYESASQGGRKVHSPSSANLLRHKYFSNTWIRHVHPLVMSRPLKEGGRSTVPQVLRWLRRKHFIFCFTFPSFVVCEST